MDSSQVLGSEEYNIDNIIESAVDELLQQKVTAHSDYDDIDVLLLSLCRLCAREVTPLVKTSDACWMVICDLKIPGIDALTVADTNICLSCLKTLNDIQQFRCLCEEGQKRITALLTQQQLLPDFLNLDFTDAKKDIPPQQQPVVEEQVSCAAVDVDVNSPLKDNAEADSTKQEQSHFSPSEVKQTPDGSNSVTDVQKDPGSTMGTLKVRKQPRQAALKVQELVKSLAAAESEAEASDTGEEFVPEKETKRHSFCTSGSESDASQIVIPVKSGARKRIPKRPAERKERKSHAPKLQSRRRMVEGRLEWVCLDCELVFESCLKLKKHRQHCELVGSERSKRYGAFACETCGDVLNTFASLCLHRYKHDTAAATGGVKVKKEPTAKVCHVCGKLFKTARSLNKHLAIHTGEKKFVCHVCDKSFSGKRYLRNHLDIHADSKRHECETCGKRFTTSMSLRNHRETHKPNYLRQQCMVCSRRFAHPYRLRKHMMIHTDELPYGCDQCGALFRKPSQLARHTEKGHACPPAPTRPPTAPEWHDFDDLIVYQPEDDLVAMLDTMKGAMPPVPQSGGPIDTAIPSEQQQPFASDHLLAEASQEFTVQCFPEVHEPDSEIYCFMEF